MCARTCYAPNQHSAPTELSRETWVAGAINISLLRSEAGRSSNVAIDFVLYAALNIPAFTISTRQVHS